MKKPPKINPKHEALVTDTTESMDKFHKSVSKFYQEVANSPKWEWDKFTENFDEVYKAFMDLRLKIRELDNIMKARR